MPASKDPKSYIKPVPLPIPACNGMKLLARDTINFNPEVPSRDDVRKNNYNRRQNQMSAMGFKSVSHKPYMGIGDPFYLDEKKMILHALGQMTEEQANSSSSSDDSDDDADDKNGATKPAFTAVKFVLRRSRRDLNTLNKAVVHGRNMIRNVSLGHGLFDLINKEKQCKKDASDAALRIRQEALRNEFQAPKNDSEEDTDEDLDNDVDLTNYMVHVAPPTFLTQQQTQMDIDEELGIVNDNASESDQSPEREPEFVTFSGMAIREDDEEQARAKSAIVPSELTYSRPVSRRKKKQETPRPYTPQHTSLSANMSMRESTTATMVTTATATEGETEIEITRDALFRQLCVLHWILEAMSTDPPSAMTPIMSSWSLMDIGGSRAQPKKIQKDKVTESQWTTFLSKDHTAKVSKRLSTARINRAAHLMRRPLYNAPGRTSAQSSATGSHQGSVTGLNAMSTQAANARNHDEPLSPKNEDEEDQAVNKSIFKFLDEYYESLKYEDDVKGNQQMKSKTSPSSTPPTSPTPEKDKINKEEKKKRDKKKRDSQSPKRLDHRIAVALGEEEKLSSKYLRANTHLIKAKSSPALTEFQNTLPSNKKVMLTADLHNQFAECREEKALTLHDILDHKEGQRLDVCKRKFLSFQGMRHGSSFFRAVEEMRTRSLKRKPSNNNKKQKGNWYTDLMENIPTELQQEWYYTKILRKLENFGMVEGTGKQSIYKFIKVLEGLREWEICSPDITSAIEFCRERIVEMTIEEYESWFAQRFPKITRPQTAPPVPTKAPEKKSEGGSTPAVSAGTARKVLPKRATQSAFARRVQR